MGDAYSVYWGHELSTDSWTWHLGRSNFYVSFWIRARMVLTFVESTMFALKVDKGIQLIGRC